MKKLILIIALALVSTGAWGKTTDASKVGLLAEYKRHDVRVTSMCIEGHIVVVSHSDVGQGGGLQMIQLQHEISGKIAPMECPPAPQDVRLLAEYKRHDIRVTNMCIEEHVVVVSHSDVGMGGGLQMIQLQHVVDGKIVPMVCDSAQQEENSEK